MEYPIWRELTDFLSSSMPGMDIRITTANGNAGGTSIIDASLIGVGVDSYVSMMIVIAPGAFDTIHSSDITAFNNATGEIDFNTAYKNGTQVVVGTPYAIITYRFVPAEVAAILAAVTALMADVGDASASTLGSLFGILGDPAVPLATSLAAVKVMTDALQVLTSTGGILTTTGAVQNLFISDAPGREWDPIVVKVEFTNHTAGETIELVQYERIADGGGWVEVDNETFAGLVSPEGIYVEWFPNRFGVWLSMQKTVGANRAYPWEVVSRL